MHDDLKQQLASAEQRLRMLRPLLARAQQIARQADRSHEKELSADSAEAARAAQDSLKQIKNEIASVENEQQELLGQLGDIEAGGGSGFASPGVDGWSEAARALSLTEGRLSFDVSASRLLAQAAPAAPASSSAATVTTDGPPVSPRLLYPALGNPLPFDTGTVVATDWVVSFADAPGTSGVTGVERPVDETDPKAELGVTTTLATVTARQHALVSEPIPNAIIDDQASFRGYLDQEMRRRLAEDFDRAVVSTIQAAALPTAVGSGDLVQDIRYAIALMSNRGAVPSLLALQPGQAADLDLTETTGGDYVFQIRLAGSGSPIWNLRVREVPEIADPTLIAPGQLGVLRLGGASIDLDPFGGGSGADDNFRTNRTRIRIEFSGRYHVRDIRGGHVIS